jgi:hypothetical protein
MLMIERHLQITDTMFLSPILPGTLSFVFSTRAAAIHYSGRELTDISDANEDSRDAHEHVEGVRRHDASSAKLSTSASPPFVMLSVSVSVSCEEDPPSVFEPASSTLAVSPPCAHGTQDGRASPAPRPVPGRLARRSVTSWSPPGSDMSESEVSSSLSGVFGTMNDRPP